MFFVSVALILILALSTGAVLRRHPSYSMVAIFVGCILCCPLLIPAHSIRLRAIAALLAGDAGFKIVDFCRHVRNHEPVPPFSAFRNFLVPYPFLLVVFHDRRMLPREFDRAAEFRWLIGALAVTALGLVLTWSVTLISLAHQNFMVDHVLKVSAFVVFLEGLSRLLFRIDRLLGFDTSLPVDSVIKSRTPAEFWQRYNTRVHRWFVKNVFIELPYRKNLFLAVTAVFVTNGLLHELMFGIATSRFDGYQLLFFVLQIPAVCLSRALKRWAENNGRIGSGVAHAVTTVWMLTTSFFFFHGVDRIFPFYSAESWLP